MRSSTKPLDEAARGAAIRHAPVEDDPPGADALRAFSRSLPMLLLRSHQAVMAEFRPILRAHGVTEQQWRVLRAQTTGPSVRAAQLAELTLISGPSLTRILRDLEARGLIRRSADRADQRAARIALAPAGRRLIAAVGPHSERRYREIARRIGEDDLQALYALLARVPERLR